MTAESDFPMSIESPRGLCYHSTGNGLGDRLMVGRETLDLVVRVRILLPQPGSEK